ncbi:MAG: hypothetical protein NZ700_09775 [Gemmataceae bacterium]|nr:hypothetical protein [Gemmataceae bacterium]MDW8266910.1 multiheme c-type cytochrome [Gemmataceae bacterium]
MRWCGRLLLLPLLGFSGGDPEPILVGRVRDDHGPVAGARVRFRGGAEVVVTDETGTFRLPGRPSASRRITAATPRHLIGSVPSDSVPLVITLQPVPSDDDEEYSWVDPAPQSAGEHRCGRCHREAYREWSASGHARSATNRWFRSLFDGSDWHGRPNVGWGLLIDHPDGAGVCTACHAPTVSPGDPAFFDLRQVEGVAARGVHCDFCHKIADVWADSQGLTHGRFALALRRPRAGQLFFGPFDDVDRGEDVYAPFYRHSRYCAPCHEGIVFGVPVYTTYSEWRESPFARQGQQCQDCHMKPTGRQTELAIGSDIRRNPWSVSNHRFFAGSRADMLRQAARLSAEVRAGSDEVVVEVAVRAESVGHRLPTGFVDRHLLLVVDGKDAGSSSLPLRRGPVLPSAAGPGWAGRPGRLYAKLLTDDSGHSPAPFWRPIRSVADTRLAPGQEDRLRLVFPPGTMQVHVQLLYRRFWKEVADLKGWPDETLVVAERRLVTPIPDR